MRNKLAKVLDECLARINEGESLEACLAEYANVQKQLEPLLQTALSISSMPRVVPSDKFRRTAKGRLMARLHREAIQTDVVPLNHGMSLLDDLAIARQRLWRAINGAKKVAIPVTLALLAMSDKLRRTAKARLMARLHREATQTNVIPLDQGTSLLDDLAMAGQRLWQAIIGAKKVAIPVTLAVLLMIGANFVASDFISPSPALASKCTLSIFNGNVEVQTPGVDVSQQGADGMTLNIGTRVKTSPDSHALLTFFDGSTIKLEPGTDIEIQQLEYDDEQAATIILKQWVGRTWSRVVKMADPGSHYEIKTPSACAIVRGTLFTTAVDEAGATMVETTEGLVSVVAQGEEISLPANQQTQVEAGMTPSQPTIPPSPTAEILINIDAPAVGSVTDPTGASTGYLQSGLSFNQILGSQSSPFAEGTQVITIPQPRSGEYIVALRYINGGAAHLDIQGKSDGKIAFEYVDKYEGASQSGWLVHLNLNVDNGRIVDSQVSKVEPLTDEKPEKIVEPKLTKEREIAIDPPSRVEEGQPVQSNDNSQGQPSSPDQGNSQGQPGSPDQGNSQGQPGSPDQSYNWGQPGSPGQSYNWWQPGSPDQGNSQGQPGSPDQGNSQGQPGSPDQGNSQDQPGSPDQGNSQGQPGSPDQGESFDWGNNQDQGKSFDWGNDQGQGESFDWGNNQGQGKSFDWGNNQGQGKSFNWGNNQGQGYNWWQPGNPGQGYNWWQPGRPGVNGWWGWWSKK